MQKGNCRIHRLGYERGNPMIKKFRVWDKKKKRHVGPPEFAITEGGELLHLIKVDDDSNLIYKFADTDRYIIMYLDIPDMVL